MKFFSEGAQRTTLSDRNSGKSRTPLVRARKKWRSTERTRSFHARIESLNKASLLPPYPDVALTLVQGSRLKPNRSWFLATEQFGVHLHLSCCRRGLLKPPVQ